jgi:hypothetical protein
MTSGETTLNLDENARRSLAQVYRLLLEWAEEGAADPDTLEGKPESAASTSGLHRCTVDDSTPAAPEQVGGCNE